MPASSDIDMEKSPWQLEMFGRSLKKQQKLHALLKFTGELSGQKCLLLTCGDNNGALNWYFRQGGGEWVWGDVTAENLDEISRFLGEKVYYVPEAQFPFADNEFDCVVAIDVLEHLADDQAFLHELRRVLKPGGRAIVTVPNGDSQLLANRLKWQLGMRPDKYGHTRAGYTVPELRSSLTSAGFQPVSDGGYSRFFTEMVELAINFSYVYILSRKKKQSAGHIAPTTSTELKQHGLAYRIYGLTFPMMRLVSKLDALVPNAGYGAVIVGALNPDVSR